MKHVIEDEPEFDPGDAGPMIVPCGEDSYPMPVPSDDEPDSVSGPRKADSEFLPESCGEDEDEPEDGETPAFRLGAYLDGDYLTRTGMRMVFKCSERTLFRMVDRFEIPPPMSVAGRSAWMVGRLREWMAAAARSREEEAMREAKRLNVMRP